MKQEIYCEITARESGILKKKIKIHVDFGDKRTRLGKSAGQLLKDQETGKALNFHSIIDALNYMAADDWCFVNAYSLMDKDNSSEYRYIMRKKVAKTEQSESDPVEEKQDETSEE